MSRAARRPDAGFSLVEVLVALAIFAMIGGAGFSILDQVLRTERQTEGRLARLAEMERAMHLIRLDFAGAVGGSVMAWSGAADGVALIRSAPERAEGQVALAYSLDDGAVIRQVSGMDGQVLARQQVLSGVARWDWRYYASGPDRQSDWREDWPPEAALVPGAGPANLRAVDVVITLADDRQLRRLALLPAEVR